MIIAARRWMLALPAAALLCGCATSTIETRKQERLAVYQSLDPEAQAFVDKGKIRVGMSQDAVYIAWGRPSDVFQSESSEGLTATWRYHGTAFQEHTRWRYRSVTTPRGVTILERYYEPQYEPHSYVRAEIVFINGVVSRWSTLPKPLY